MLTILNLNYESYSQKILNNISLTVLPGSIYLLKGPNASGKTSLLKLLAGILKPSSGSILWKNKEMECNHYNQNIIAYLGHKLSIDQNLTVIENLEFWANLKNTELLLQPAITYFKLEKHIDTKCEELSAGWQKRVALARMIVSNCELWLLDEPENNLDNESIELLLKLLQVKISAGGMTIIASHNQEYYNKLPVISLLDFKCG